MIQTSMNSNKQMRYQVVLLVYFKDVQQSITKCKNKCKYYDIKHANACVVQNILSFFSFFLLNNWPLKVSREYTCQDFDAKRENKFLIVQLMSTVVKTIMVLYV
jgi:hypothetical protein